LLKCVGEKKRLWKKKVLGGAGMFRGGGGGGKEYGRRRDKPSFAFTNTLMYTEA